MRPIELVLTGTVNGVISSTRIDVRSYRLADEDNAVEELRREFSKRRKEIEPAPDPDDETPALFEL